MKQQTKVSRRDSAVAILFLTWGFAVVAFTAGARFYSLFPPQFRPLRCPFKEMTGIPCATCGSTRTFALMGEGKLLAALKLNPFVFLGSVLGVVLAFYTLGAYAGFWRFSRPDLVERHKTALTVVLVILFLGNWVYLIWSGV